MNALVIIDMQDKYLKYGSFFGITKELFEKKKQSAIRNIIKKIREYKIKKLPIIVVNFWGYCLNDRENRLNKDIYNAIGNYTNIFYTWKKQCDGSKEILKSIKDIIDPDTYEVCGCYTSACVLETVIGLSKLVNSRTKINVLYSHTFDTVTLDVNSYKNNFNSQVRVI